MHQTTKCSKFSYISRYISIILIVFPTKHVVGLPSVIKIGAIFNADMRSAGSVDLAFQYAVDRINHDETLLPFTQITYDLQYVSLSDTFRVSKLVCRQVQSGVQAIFGPTDASLSAHIQSVSDALDIPHIQIRVDLEPPVEYALSPDQSPDSVNAANKNGFFRKAGRTHRPASINVYPDSALINTAIVDVMRFLNWTQVSVIFEPGFGLLRLHQLIRTPDIEVHVLRADHTTYATILAELKANEQHNILVDTRTAHMRQLLTNIVQLQMNEYKYHYLFTTFDIDAIDLEDLKYNFFNVTAFRLVDSDDIGIHMKLMEMARFVQREKHMSGLQSGGINSSGAHVTDAILLRNIQTSSALIYDAVHVFAVGLQLLEQSHDLRASNATCSVEQQWDDGLSLINYINAVEWKGLSGPIGFNEGVRTQFKLDLVKLKPHAIVKVGEWTPEHRLNISDPDIFVDTGKINMTLVVITILETPYVQMHYGKNFTGNKRFFGFCVDILDRVAHNVGFDYILDLVPDRKYGAKDPVTGKWNGMVAQLMNHKADLAVGSMTINYARESVIDFTKPFMNLGISILFKVPESTPTRLFSFMTPLAVDIWLFVFSAYIIVSLSIHFIAHFSPYEWYNPHPCDAENITMENQFTVANSFWFAIGTLMQQGSDLNPRAISTRIASGMWWFFTLIIISSYTANLAAFLTVERMITPIQNSEDLASQAEIAYGTLESGSTMTFFRDSMIETYKKMWRFMENKKPSVFTTTYEEGIQRVLGGNYAFLMESTMLDYIVQRDCNLTQIGGLLDTKGYGIATPMGSPWRDRISLAILVLQEKGDIQMLYDKWWKVPGEQCVRATSDRQLKESKANALDLDNIGGIFVVLLAGLAFAVLVAVQEFCINYKYGRDCRCHNAEQMMSTDVEESHLLKSSGADNYGRNQFFPSSSMAADRMVHPTLCDEMTEELCFAVKCYGRRQRPALKRVCAQCEIVHETNIQF